MIRKIGIGISFLLIFVANLKAQNSQITGLTLDNCIAIALDNNLDLKSTKLTAKTSEVNYNQSRSDMIPSLNANFNLGLNNGRSIDPFTNGFIDQELTFSYAGLSLMRRFLMVLGL